MLRRGSAQFLLHPFCRVKRHAALLAAGANVTVILGALTFALLPASVVSDGAPRLGQSAILLDQAEGTGPIGVEPAVDFRSVPLPERRPTLTAARSLEPCLPTVRVGDRISLGAEGASREFEVTQSGIEPPGRKRQRQAARGATSIECWFTDPRGGTRLRIVIEAKPIEPAPHTPGWQQKL